MDQKEPARMGFYYAIQVNGHSLMADYCNLRLQGNNASISVAVSAVAEQTIFSKKLPAKIDFAIAYDRENHMLFKKAKIVKWEVSGSRENRFYGEMDIEFESWKDVAEPIPEPKFPRPARILTWSDWNLDRNVTWAKIKASPGKYALEVQYDENAEFDGLGLQVLSNMKF